MSIVSGLKVHRFQNFMKIEPIHAYFYYNPVVSTDESPREPCNFFDGGSTTVLVCSQRKPLLQCVKK